MGTDSIRMVEGAGPIGLSTSTDPLSTPLTLSQAKHLHARLIRGGLGASMYHINLGGFDTHSNQINRHAALMSELSGAIGSFMADLQVDELDKRVVVMTFSEFGRRVYQNGSGGTDHGTAAPLFLFGGGIAGGIHGAHPSLSDLDDGGNLKYGVDFRSVYGSVLSD